MPFPNFTKTEIDLMLRIPVIVRCFNCGLDISGYQCANGVFFGFTETDDGYICDSCLGFRERANNNLLKFTYPSMPIGLMPDSGLIPRGTLLLPVAAPPVSPIDAPDSDLSFLLGIAEECEGIMVLAGFDDALIGIGGALGTEVAVYDTGKVIDMIMKRDNLSYESADEYFRTCVAVKNVGAKTPIYVDYTDLGCLKPRCACKKEK